MCAVSFVSDYGIKAWPSIEDAHKDAYYKELEALLEAARKFDKKTGQPDCEDAKKTADLAEIKRQLTEINEKLGKL